MLNGILVGVMSDQGPAPMFCTADLSEELQFKITISLMTAIGFGNQNSHLNQLHGPLPIPNESSLLTLAFPIRVFDPETKDERILESGREIVLFLIISSDNRKKVHHYFDQIEQLLQKHTKKIKFFQEITFNHIKRIEVDLNKILVQEEKITEKKHIKNIKSEKKEELPATAKELLALQHELETFLKKWDTPTEPPITKTGFERLKSWTPQISWKTVLRPLAHRYRQLILNLAANHKELLSQVVKKEIVMLCANFLFYGGLKAANQNDLELAKNMYMLAISLEKNPLFYLSIGSILNWQHRQEEAKDWIIKGFSLKAKTGTSIPLSRELLFGNHSKN